MHLLRRRLLAALIPAACLLACATTASARPKPILNMGGVWVGEVPGKLFACGRTQRLVAPPFRYTLTVKPRPEGPIPFNNNASARSQYDVDLEVEGYFVAFEPGKCLVESFTPCFREFGEQNFALSVSRLDGFGLPLGYSFTANVVQLDANLPQTVLALDQTNTPMNAVMNGTIELFIDHGGNSPPLDDCRGARGIGLGAAAGDRAVFRRVAGFGGPVSTGIIRGKVESSQPTSTLTENEVQRAKLILYRLNDGRPVREQGTTETNAEYADFLKTVDRDIVDTLVLEPDENGTYPFGTPGAFEFSDVPLVYLRAEGGYTQGYYIIEVKGAQTDEIEFDGMGNPIPGSETPLHFGDAAFENIRVPPPGTEEFIGLLVDPLDASQAKRNIIESLSAVCPNNYAPTEEFATQWLDDVDSGTVTLTDAVNEGIRRAVWAERASLAGVQFVDDMVGRSLKGLGNLMSDLFSDLVKFESKQLADARKRANAMRANGGVPPGFGQGAVPGDVLRRSADARQLVGRSDMGAFMGQFTKSLKPRMEWLALTNGADPETAEFAATAATLMIASLAEAIKTANPAAAAKETIKLIIKQVVLLFKPVFVDGTALLNSPLAYCAVTSNDLLVSIDKMRNWSSVDPDAYVFDRGLVIDTITTINREATDVIARADQELGAASGLSAVSNAAGAFGQFLPWFKIVEKGTKITGYFLNATAFAESILFPYLDLPPLVRTAIYNAYGETAPAALVSEREFPPTPTAPVNVTAPPAGGYGAALARVRAALAADDIALAMNEAAGGTETSLVNARAVWNRDVARFLFLAEAVQPGPQGTAMQPILEKSRAARLDMIAAEALLWHRLSDLFFHVVTETYPSTEDARYLAERDNALSQLDLVDFYLSQLDTPLADVERRFAFVDPGSAVIAEFDSLLSDHTGEETVSLAQETFILTANVANLGGIDVSNLSARLNLVSPNGSLTIVGVAEQPVRGGTLSADDATIGSGTDEAKVAWALAYDGNLDPEVMMMSIDLLEAGTAPSAFIENSFEIFLTIDPDIVDTDLDRMPNGYETANGLNPAVDDADGDLDQDGLTNLQELDLTTEPDDDDTDNDGLSDYEEVVGGADGLRSNPLLADTDGDGTLDAADGAPTDPSSTLATPEPEPSVALSTTEVLISDETPWAIVDVTNAGSGTLIWSAEPVDDSLVATTPSFPAVSGEGQLFLTPAPALELAGRPVLTTTVRVKDIAGNTPDEQVLTVRMGAVRNGSECGDANDSSLDDTADITATDALQVLQSAVGLTACEVCRCDVDGSSKITVSDALAILLKAVGRPIDLICGSCG